MDRGQVMTLVGIAALVAVTMAVPGDAGAQNNCEAMPAGPARTDCFIGRARIQGAKSDIATTKARHSTDAAVLGVTTGTSPKPKARAKTKRKPRNK
jgi:hypothetical protein